MKTAIIQSESNANLKLLLELAHKLGMRTRALSEEEKEDIALLAAMEEGKKSGKVPEKKVFDALNKWK